MYNSILNKIKEYDSITIFRHQRPDGDCMFSALALHSFIRDNFKEKTVKIAGNDEYDIITKKDRISDAYIRRSLAIVVDTATAERVDDNRFMEADFIIKIDHHPAVDDYGDINYVNSKAAATCEIMADMFRSKEFSSFVVSKKTCRYLYCGMITDTLNFKTTNTTYHTLDTASYLAKTGDLKISDLVEYVMNVDLDTFQKLSKIRSYFKVKEKFGYILLNKKQLDQIGIGAAEAKSHIDEIGNIDELKIWAFAVENNGRYDCSVRSKRGYIINTICSKYHGGGHSNAAAVKQIEKSSLDHLFSELIELSTK